MPFGEDGNRIPDDVRQRLNAIMAGKYLPDGLAESPRLAIRGVDSELTRVRDQHAANRERSELLDLLASNPEAQAIRRGMKR
jgi:hypothetical protein